MGISRRKATHKVLLTSKKKIEESSAQRVYGRKHRSHHKITIFEYDLAYAGIQVRVSISAIGFFTFAAPLPNTPMAFAFG